MDDDEFDDAAEQLEDAKRYDRRWGWLDEQERLQRLSASAPVGPVAGGIMESGPAA